VFIRSWVALFPGSSPAFCRIQYREEAGNKARSWVQFPFLCLFSPSEWYRGYLYHQPSKRVSPLILCACVDITSVVVKIGDNLQPDACGDISSVVVDIGDNIEPQHWVLVLAFVETLRALEVWVH